MRSRHRLVLPKRGGDFVLKTFGNAQLATRECIALLAYCYETVSIIKPFTSRATNDERYIVCQNFLPGNVPRKLLENFQKLSPRNDMFYLITLGIQVNNEWMQELDYIVYTMNQQQMWAIDRALTSTFPNASGPTGRGSSGRKSQTKGRHGHSHRGRGRGFQDGHRFDQTKGRYELQNIFFDPTHTRFSSVFVDDKLNHIIINCDRYAFDHAEGTGQ